MLKLKQKLKELFSFLWNEFPKRYSSRVLFIYTIYTTVMIWWPFVFLCFLPVIGISESGLGFIWLFALAGSIILNIFFGIFFYILLYCENIYPHFRKKNSSVGKFHRAVLVFFFFLFFFDFIVSLSLFLMFIFDKNTIALGESFRGIFYTFFSPLVLFDIGI